MPPTYLVETRTTKEVELPRDQVLTIQQAADILGITPQGVSSALHRGTFTTLLQKTRRGKTRSHHRRLLRSEVEAAAAEQAETQ
jgi:predicted transcriptional regulator